MAMVYFVIYCVTDTVLPGCFSRFLISHFHIGGSLFATLGIKEHRWVNSFSLRSTCLSSTQSSRMVVMHQDCSRIRILIVLVLGPFLVNLRTSLEKYPSNEDESFLVNTTTQNYCLISSWGSDGIGHQLEAKISCIATAAVLDDLRYVHSSMNQSEHGTNSIDFEDFVGLQHSFSNMKPSIIHDGPPQNNMVLVPRKPLPNCGECRGARSWFDADIRKRECQNASSGAVVFSADNCWDFFYCQLKKADNATIATLETAVLQVLNKGYRERHKNPFPDHHQLLTVVVHIRRGDSRRRKMGSAFYSNVISQLMDAAGGNLRIVIHTDAQGATRQGLLPGLASHANVTIRDYSVSIQEVFDEMVQADIFVASRSSLSNAAGLLGRPGRPILYPFDKSRMGLSSLRGWRVLRQSAKDMECFDRPNWKWDQVDSDFYRQVIADAKKLKTL
jgi:hypothetical protein